MPGRSPNYNELAKRIAQRLIDLGRTQAWLAAESGVPQGTISSWGSRGSKPELSNAVAIARVLGTTVEWLYDGREAETRQAEYKTPAQREMIEFIVDLDRDMALELSGAWKMMINQIGMQTAWAARKVPVVNKPAKKKIGEGLVSSGKMTQKQVEKVLQVQKEHPDDHKYFGEIALELMYINRETLDEYLRDL